MAKIDLEESRFTQAEVLALVSDLSAKTLQNWNDLGLINPENPKPGRHGKRLYNAAGVVCLAFLAAVASQGIRPGIARELAATVWKRTLEIHDYYPAQERDGRLRWVIAGNDPELYARGHIFKYEGRYVLLLDDNKRNFEVLRTLFPRVYITVELDYLIIAKLDRIYAFLAGVDVTKSMAYADSPEGWALIAEKAKFSQPTGVERNARTVSRVRRRSRVRKRSPE